MLFVVSVISDLYDTFYLPLLPAPPSTLNQSSVCYEGEIGANIFLHSDFFVCFKNVQLINICIIQNCFDVKMKNIQQMLRLTAAIHN